MPLDDFLKRFKLSNLDSDDPERRAIEGAQESTERRERGLPKKERTRWEQPGVPTGNYIKRFREILDNRPTPERRQRVLEALKDRLHKELIIKPESDVFTVSSLERTQEIVHAKRNAQGKPIDAAGEPYPLSHFDKRIIRFYEEGRGIGTVPPEERQQEIQTIIAEQTRSLDTWIDYLASDDATYPDALKYWALRSILKMGRYDKDKTKFTNREGQASISPFPDLNREALAIVLGDLEKKYAGKTDVQFTSRYDIPEPQKQAYRTALEKENFANLYALAIDAFKPISKELLAITDGAWKSYRKGSDPQVLVDDIANYGTGWCIRGEPTARRYLEHNDLHVYFSKKTKDGVPEIPRVVMVINAENQIAEVRGVEQHEHLDSHIGDIVEQRLQEHPDGAKYKKKSADMKRLTELETLIKSGTFDSLDKEEQKKMLQFLYEVDSRIEGFGYEAAGRDPRIEEIRSKRNPKEDLPILFGCAPDQIALIPKEISSHTKAYIGPLQPGIFTLLAQHNIEHIYTSFPEGQIRRESLDVGGMTAEQLEAAMDKAKINTGTYARSMLKNKKQFIEPVNKRHRERKGSPETLHLVRLRVRDLGYTDPNNLPTIREIFGDPGKKNGRIHALGLELCPPETGPYQRLADKDQPLGDWYYIGMEPITDSDGSPGVFGLGRFGGGVWLSNYWAGPGGQWDLDRGVLLRRRKSGS
ncbi:hypothetical protein HYS30_01415 [Candidatus Peregrinibacteria bacterium]|nr:hypothetical protein [Candidatus Peregrinibacteria bacterium]